uniref:Uncharacterized protein n=1 Tax=Ditylenchus dipsaci TaxID=166011 RepID=A0A915DZJ9_9BILA
MSCMSTVGFGNIASTTFSEKVFGVCIDDNFGFAIRSYFWPHDHHYSANDVSTVRYHEMISNKSFLTNTLAFASPLMAVYGLWRCFRGFGLRLIRGDTRRRSCCHLGKGMSLETFWSTTKTNLMHVLTFTKAFANSFARNLVLTYNLTNRLKFRKVLDVKRELEWTRGEKNEKMELSEDHPVRKLLQKCRKDTR